MFDYLSPTFIIAILIALSVHECAHAWVALRLGDPTGFNEGRVTLNPIAHLDPLGSILFLLAGFGWGKPVPIVPQYFRNPKLGTALTAAAGPTSNLLLAIIAFVLIMLLGVQSPSTDVSIFMQFLGQLLRDSVELNLGLMAFNMLPIAPLDGSKVLHLWIPYQYDDLYITFMARGPIILLILLGVGRIFYFDPLYWWINMITDPILNLFAAITTLFV